jgi:hypothetical protein
MKTGVIIKSDSFNSKPYWVIKCDEFNLPGSKNDELPIEPTSMPDQYPIFMGRAYPRPLLNRKVKFEIVERGGDRVRQCYAYIKGFIS